MRDSEGRQRHFVIRDKKDESYDSPSVRRRGVIKEREEKRTSRPSCAGAAAISV